MSDKKLTYKDAGVDITAGNNFVELIKKSVKSTYIPGVMGDIGGFGGLFELAKYKNPVLISKKYGMLKSYDFYTFPNIENSNSFSDFFNSSILTLVGMTNPRLGIQNLTSFDIFDFSMDLVTN